MNPPEAVPARHAVTSLTARSWLDRTSQRIVLLAASHTPPDLAHRLAEEWLSDLNERHSTGARLCFALGCCWAMRVISLEALTASRAAARAIAPASVTLYAQPVPSLLTPRSAVVLLIMAIHGVLVYALATGLARTAIENVVPRISASFPTSPPPAKPSPPVIPGPHLVRQSIQVPQPDPNIEAPLDLEQALPVTAAVPQVATDPDAAAAQPALHRIPGGPGRDFPNTEDFYPSASKRMQETGAATVVVCVNEAGRLTREPALERSSGYVRLDQAAVKLARAGSGRYRATTENGQPVAACYPFKIRFELRE